MKTLLRRLFVGVLIICAPLWTSNAETRPVDQDHIDRHYGIGGGNSGSTTSIETDPSATDGGSITFGEITGNGTGTVKYGVGNSTNLNANDAKDCSVDTHGRMPQDCVAFDPGMIFTEDQAGASTVMYGVAAGTNLSASLDCRVNSSGQMPAACVVQTGTGGDVVADSSASETTVQGTAPESQTYKIPVFSDADGKHIDNIPSMSWSAPSGASASSDAGGTFNTTEAADNGTGIFQLKFPAAVTGALKQATFIGTVSGTVAVAPTTAGVNYSAITVDGTLDTGTLLCGKAGLTCVASTTTTHTVPSDGGAITDEKGWACGTDVGGAGLFIRAGCN